ncbi:MAG: phytoene/squalene synthase family protein [Calditrichia bacterium]
MKIWKNPEYRYAFSVAREITRHYSKSFYLSTLALPEKKRWATFALYGFCRYADNLIDNPRKRTPEQLKQEVQYLSEEIRIAYQTGESEHPILKSFIPVALEHGIPIDLPLGLLKGVMMDLDPPVYKTFDQLYEFAYYVAAVVGLMMTHVLGYKDKSAFRYAEKLGIAMQLTNILRDVKEDKEQGRIYLPEDELQLFGLTRADVFNENFNDQFRKFMKFQIERARSYYNSASKGIILLEPESRFAIYSAGKIYSGILHKLVLQDYNPFKGRVFVPQGKKAMIMFSQILRSKWETIIEKLFPGQEKPVLQK